MKSNVFKLHLGVPYLDAIIDSDIKNEYSEGGAVPPTCGSIPVPGADFSRMNILIKGDPGSGKTVLACQIALNLANDVFFLRTNVEADQRTFHKYHQKSFGDTHPFDRVIMPIVFSFGQSIEELNFTIRQVFFTDGKKFQLMPGDLSDRGVSAGNELSDPILPIIVGLRDRDIRSYPQVDEINECIAELQHEIEKQREEYANKLKSDGMPGKESESEIEARIDAQLRRSFPKFSFSIVDTGIGRRILDSVRDGEIVYTIFIDSINILFEDLHDRVVLHKLLSLSRDYRTIFFHLLEDYSSAMKPDYLYLSRSLEFEADVVINLSAESLPYYKRHIEVTKSRYSPRVNGVHLYKILAVGNPISALERRVGFLIYNSIHNHFVISRHSGPESTIHTTSGIKHLDRILQRSGDSTKGEIVPRDSFFLIRGRSGGHKLTLGFNILIGNLDKTKKQKVLLISFHDEISDISKIAISYDNEDKFASPFLKSEKSDAGQSKFGSAKFKVGRHKIVGCDKETELVVVTMRPGYLTVEEFLYAFEQFISEFEPDRVLFDNTNLLKMCFSELGKEPVLFAALIRYLKAHEIMSIVIDVTGEGSDSELSYGLAGMADYILQTETFSHFLENDLIYRKYFDFTFEDALAVQNEGDDTTQKPYVRGEHKKTVHTYYPLRIYRKSSEPLDRIQKSLIALSNAPDNENLIDLSILTVANVRNKIYSKSIHGITAVMAEDIKKYSKALRPIIPKAVSSVFLMFDLPRLLGVSFEKPSK